MCTITTPHLSPTPTYTHQTTSHYITQAKGALAAMESDPNQWSDVLAEADLRALLEARATALLQEEEEARAEAATAFMVGGWEGWYWGWFKGVGKGVGGVVLGSGSCVYYL